MSEEVPDILSQLLGGNTPSSVEEMRSMLDQFGGLLNADLPEVGAFHEAVPVCDGVSADVVVPKGEGPHPVLVYLHGGGWICGSPTTHRKLGYRFAESGFLVLNIDYRMAPEYPFPTPFDDCVAALRWAHAECSRYGGDPARMAVGGDSAGGNLSAADAAALEGDSACPKAALLIYGVFDFGDLASLQASEAAESTGLSQEAGDKMTALMMDAYLGHDNRDELIRDPRVSPLHLASKLPPSHVVCGTADVLLSQSENLRSALEKADVEHEYFEDEGMPHGYVQMEFLPPCRSAIDRMIGFLRRTL
ncbi:MAG: alpha/beta hydrolase [Myxococcota bacterium]|nr:alpha/beta hydrolase [Myxococcota bacterium]